MLDLNLFQKVLNILENGYRAKKTIVEVLFSSGYTEEWWVEFQSKVEAAYIKSRISVDDYNKYKTLLVSIEGKNMSKDLGLDVNYQSLEAVVNKIIELAPHTKNDPDKKIAYKLGELLLILKNALPDGTYIQFIESNFSFSQRTARSYTKTFFDLGGTFNVDYQPSFEDIKSFNPLEESKSLFHMLNEPALKDLEDDYDSRSSWWVDRDEEGKITRYHYSILVRDSMPLTGSLSLVQMEEIFRKYPYVTQNTISQDFPYLTFTELKKIIRCFNITKDKLFPQHIIENHTEEELAEFALKAKESAGMKKMIEKKSEYFEKRFKDTQKNLLEIQSERQWIETCLHKYFDEDRQRATETIKFSTLDNNENTSEKQYTRLFCFMSDLHIGKCYEHPIYGRGYNKQIAKERFEQMAFHICRESSKYEHLTILCGGDITESIMEDGLHHGIHRQMDMFQDDQIMYALDLFYTLFSTILENTNFKSIELLGLEGNHDRIGSQRHDDKNRTAAKIVYRFLQREWKDKITVILAEDGIINQKRENICIISHHGDANLAKKKGDELVNLFGDGKRFYHLVVKGHLHHLECKEGTNFLNITLPSVCSADTYSITEFAQNSQPGFILGHQAEFGLGFDFKKVTLF